MQLNRKQKPRQKLHIKIVQYRKMSNQKKKNKRTAYLHFLSCLSEPVKNVPSGKWNTWHKNYITFVVEQFCFLKLLLAHILCCCHCHYRNHSWKIKRLVRWQSVRFFILFKSIWFSCIFGAFLGRRWVFSHQNIVDSSLM
jgi:hypothetical protein